MVCTNKAERGMNGFFLPTNWQRIWRRAGICNGFVPRHGGERAWLVHWRHVPGRVNPFYAVSTTTDKQRNAGYVIISL